MDNERIQTLIDVCEEIGVTLRVQSDASNVKSRECSRYAF